MTQTKQMNNRTYCTRQVSGVMRKNHPFNRIIRIIELCLILFFATHRTLNMQRNSIQHFHVTCVKTNRKVVAMATVL